MKSNRSLEYLDIIESRLMTGKAVNLEDIQHLRIMVLADMLAVRTEVMNPPSLLIPDPPRSKK